jgi:hypothetical protein
MITDCMLGICFLGKVFGGIGMQTTRGWGLRDGQAQRGHHHAEAIGRGQYGIDLGCDMPPSLGLRMTIHVLHEVPLGNACVLNGGSADVRYL